MRSVNGKRIKFTLQRTPTDVWAGAKIEPTQAIEMPEFEIKPDDFDEWLRECIDVAFNLGRQRREI